MNINMLSKNSVGVITTLLLIILLSESRLFKIITDTYLGRTLLIIILLFASYLNKIIGTVCVFIIIIMFSIMKFNYEGFENNDPQVSEEKKEDKKDVTEVTNDSKNVLQDETINKAIEGFDLPTIETNIRNGKQSNSIPLNQYNNQSIEVSPYESSTFTNVFGFV